MTGVKDRHIVLLCHLVDRAEERVEILFGVDVLFSVGREKNVFALFKSEARVNVARLDLGEVAPQHLCHRRARHVGALLGKTAVGKVAARVLGICHIHVRDDIDDASIRLLGQTLVLATVARFHMEDRNVQTLRTDDRETRVRVSEHEHGVGLNFNHQLIRLCDDISAGLAKVGADSVKIDVGVGKL